jgi:hypothetical protein
VVSACGSPVSHRTDWSWSVLVKGMVIMATSCDCMTHCLALSKIVNQLQINCSNSCEALAERTVESVAYKNILCNGDTRKHRIDEDFKKSVIETLIKQRKITSVGSGVKVWAGLTNQATARRWADTYVVERNLAARDNITVRRALLTNLV